MEKTVREALGPHKEVVLPMKTNADEGGTRQVAEEAKVVTSEL